MKDVINADEYEFVIKRPARPYAGYGVYLNHDSFSCERMLCEFWTVSECKNWIHSHFVGEKGTHFNIKIIESDVRREYVAVKSSIDGKWRVMEKFTAPYGTPFSVANGLGDAILQGARFLGIDPDLIEVL